MAGLTLVKPAHSVNTLLSSVGSLVPRAERARSEQREERAFYDGSSFTKLGILVFLNGWAERGNQFCKSLQLEQFWTTLSSKTVNSRQVLAEAYRIQCGI